jgi:phosphoglucosamine mutase
MTIDDLGVQVIRTGVGDNNVSEALKAGGDFGGEPSGAWIFPESSLCPDGIYAAAMLVEIASRRKLSELVDASEHYPIRRGCVKRSINLGKLEPDLISELGPVSIQRIDGIKLNLEDGWVLIRRSGTEPITRLTVEARTELRMNDIFKQTEKLMLESTG